MKNGYGAPFVSVVDGEDKHIRALVVSLKYSYRQEGGDTCMIKLRSANTSLVDLAEIQHGKKLVVKWGYIRGQASPERTVYIIDSEEAFDEKGVMVTLKCFPRAEYMKMVERNLIAPGSNIDEVAYTLAKASGVEYTGTEDEYALRGGLNRKPITQNDDGTENNAIDNTAVYRHRHYDLVVQAGIKDYSQIEKMKAAEPGGPWDLVARDDTLVMVKRDFSAPPERYWRWKGGDGQLLKFKYSSNNRDKLSKATNVEVSEWNGESKTFKEGNFNSTTDTNTVLGEQQPTSVRSSTLSQAVDDSGAPFKDVILGTIVPGYASGRIAEETIKYFNGEDDPDGLNDEFYLEEGEREAEDLDEPSNPLKGYASTSIDSSGRVWYTPFDGTPTVDQFGGDLPDDVGELKNLDRIVPFNAIVPLDLSTKIISTDPDASDDRGGAGNAAALGDNERAKAAMEIHSGSAKMVGYPSTMSGTIISILGVGVKNSGNWYILEATHVVEVGKAYLMDTKLLRNGAGLSDTGGNLTKTNLPTNNEPSTATEKEEQILITEAPVSETCRLLTLAEKEIYAGTILASQEAVGFYNYLNTGFEIKEGLETYKDLDGTVQYGSILFDLILDLEDRRFVDLLALVNNNVTSERVKKLLTNFEKEYGKMATAIDRGIICPKDENEKVLKPRLDLSMKALRTYLTKISTLLESKGL